MNVFDLMATISLDDSEYQTGLSGAKDAASQFGSTVAGGFATAAKATVAATTAAAGATVTLTKSAVTSYADYQQLVGGVDKLFGDASGRLQEYAANAYKTSGLSANQYMEQATSFSAALINSLGGDTAKAADMTDVAMRAIADNVNTFGSDMGSVQNAFQGFAKQNYTMLDNLKLGYGGTKEEMERLISDANEYAASIGMASDLSMENFGDIIQAVELIQEKQGVAGTTAKEASATISGSLGMVSAAWQNLVVGIANGDADLGSLISNFAGSVKSASKNILPQISQAMEGVGQLVEEIAPVIAEAIPTIINDMLPSLLESGAELVTTLVQGITEQAPAISEGIMQILNLLITTIAENLPMIIQAGITLITTLSTSLANEAPTLVPVILDAVILIVQTLIQNAPLLLEAALTLITALAQGLIDYIPELIARLPEIIASIVETLVGMSGEILSAGIQLLIALGAGLIEAIPELVMNIPEILTAMVDGLLEGLGSFAEVGADLIEGLWNGIKDAKDWIMDKIAGFADDVLDGIKDFFGIHSPSTEMAEIGDYMAQGLAKGWDDSVGDVIDKMNDDMDLEGSVQFEADTEGFDETPTFAGGGAQLAGAAGDIIIPVYIGQTKLDEILVRAEQLRNYRSGGR